VASAIFAGSDLPLAFFVNSRIDLLEVEVKPRVIEKHSPPALLIRSIFVGARLEHELCMSLIYDGRSARIFRTSLF
jgi:hypothetical protein